MDCRGSALILHALLPTSTLGLFSTEAKEKDCLVLWSLLGHVVIVQEGLISLFINTVKHSKKKKKSRNCLLHLSFS